MSKNPNPKKEHSFTKKVWIVGFIFSLIVTVLLIFEATFDILILVLAGALIACYFRGLSDLIEKRTKWNATIALAISIILTLIITLGLIYFIGATVSNQLSSIIEGIPAMLKDVQSYLDNSSWGREIIHQAKAIKSSEGFGKFASTFFASTFSGITNIYVVLIVGIFFTINPSLYVHGIVQLVPPKNRNKAKKLMNHLGSGLKKWLFGKFIAMVFVFILTALGLLILGFPMWLTLAIIAGFLNFIPNFGPLAAMVPAILIALSISPTMALTVACLYLVIQLVESTLITPEAQKKLIKIPPALIILAQIFVGALTGIWGVIFATPLILIIMILVQTLYIEPMNSRNEN